MYNFLWESKLIIWSLVDWKQFDKKTTWWMVSLYHGIKILCQVRILSLILQLLVNNYTGGRNVGCDIAEYLLSKMDPGKVGVWLPWWCHALVFPVPGNWGPQLPGAISTKAWHHHTPTSPGSILLGIFSYVTSNKSAGSVFVAPDLGLICPWWIWSLIK